MNMNKKTFQKVLIASIGFLVFVTFMAIVFRHFADEATKPAVAKAEEKVMYLTFDDGPSKHTAEVLNILKENDVKATFFVTGEFPEYESMIKEEKDQGHAIGVHTYSHDYAKIYTSPEAYFKDIDEVNEIIKRQTGSTTPFLRFPGGASNTVSRKYNQGIMTVLSKQVQDKGYQYYDWNAENGDGNPGLSADTLIETALKEAKGKQSVMMLMHDGAGNGETVKALPAILKEFKAQGYEFKVIDPTTPIFHHHIAN